MPSYHLDLVTPERTVFSGDVTSLTAPSTEGLFGVLPGHAALLTSLAVGLLSFVQADGQPRQAAVSGGFAEVEKGRVVILAETAELADEIDVPRARQALARAREALAQGPKGGEADQLRQAVARAQSRLRAAAAD
jgi:F-type H+-transporting ATPase subunit epsilon